MRKTTKFALVCGCMIGIGMILMAAGYAMGGRVWGITAGSGGIRVNTPDNSGAGTREYMEETRELEAFTDIEAKVEFCDLMIEPSDHFGISYCVDKNYRFVAEVKDGRLVVTQKTEPTFGSMMHGGAFVVFGTGNMIDGWTKDQYVKIYVPASTQLGDVKLINDNGRVTGSGILADKVELEAGFGDVSLDGLEAGGIEITMDNGKLEAKQMRGDTLTISQKFGDIILEDAKVKGAAVISNSNGSCDLKGADMDDIEITSEFGDVAVELKYPVSEYTLKLATEFGDVTVDHEDMGDRYKSLETKNRKLTVTSDNGDIDVCGGQ